MTVTTRRGTSDAERLPTCVVAQVEGFGDQAIRGQPVARGRDEILDHELVGLHFGDHGLEQVAQPFGRSSDAARPPSGDVDSGFRRAAELVERVGGGRYAVRKPTRG